MGLASCIKGVVHRLKTAEAKTVLTAAARTARRRLSTYNFLRLQMCGSGVNRHGAGNDRFLKVMKRTERGTIRISTNMGLQRQEDHARCICTPKI
jgi:hypothetical protein